MHKKRIKILILFMVFVSTLLFFIVFFLYRENKYIPKEIYAEHGTDGLSLEIPHKHFTDVEIETEDDHEVGTYLSNINFKHFKIPRTREITIIIQDTKPPILTKSTDIVYVKYGDDTPINWEEYFKFEDTNEITLTLSENIDVHEVGIKTYTLLATDPYNNKEEVTFEIEVLPKPTPSNVEPQKPKTDPNVQPFYVDGILIVNKKHPLPKSYALGEDPVAAKKAKELIRDMQNLGFDVSNTYSGYRSYELQEYLFDRYSKRDGVVKAETYSARPGYSEHQSGLAFDILQGSTGTLINIEPEITWIREHAHEYGFIVRYLEGKTHITGYKYEPWHLRYVGDIASDIYQSGLTLEEYFNVSGGDYIR